MTRKFFLPLLAICGALLGLFVVFKTQRKVPVPPIIFKPAVSPYEESIAGAGVIEASSNNIAIGTPFNEIVTKIYVKEGDFVKTGDILFELDIRNFNAQLESAEASLKEAQILFEDKRTQYGFYERIKDTRAVSEQAYQQAYYAFLEAEENVKVAQANIDIAKSNIDRSTIRAPIDGELLQVNIHPGELAPVNPFTSTQSNAQAIANGSIMLMGRVHPLQVRIDIDENDAWRYRPGSRATGFVRGNSDINFPLEFVRVQPFIIPKSSFTGQTTERVDTRVLQVLYRFQRDDFPVYTGQVLDIFIEAEAMKTVAKE